MELILNVIGIPDEEQIQSICQPKQAEIIKTLVNKYENDIPNLFPNASSLATDLLQKMLIFDPKKRIKVEQALEHPYLENLHYPEDEGKPVCAYDFEFENQTLSADELKDLVYEEILLYHFPEKLAQYENDREEYEQKRLEKQQVNILILDPQQQEEILKFFMRIKFIFFNNLKEQIIPSFFPCFACFIFGKRIALYCFIYANLGFNMLIIKSYQDFFKFVQIYFIITIFAIKVLIILNRFFKLLDYNYLLYFISALSIYNHLIIAFNNELDDIHLMIYMK